MNNALRNILRFIILLIAQIFICNPIELWDFMTPQIYILALLILPTQLPKWSQYLIAFCYGFIIDCFTQNLGIHTTAALTLIVLRSPLLFLLNGRKPIDTSFLPTPGNKPFGWILTYTLLLTFIHQFTLNILEAFTFRMFFQTLFFTIINTIISTILLLFILHIFYNEKKFRK